MDQTATLDNTCASPSVIPFISMPMTEAQGMNCGRTTRPIKPLGKWPTSMMAQAAVLPVAQSHMSLTIPSISQRRMTEPTGINGLQHIKPHALDGHRHLQRKSSGFSPGLKLSMVVGDTIYLMRQTTEPDGAASVVRHLQSFVVAMVKDIYSQHNAGQHGHAQPLEIQSISMLSMEPTSMK